MVSGISMGINELPLILIITLNGDDGWDYILAVTLQAMVNVIAGLFTRLRLCDSNPALN
jgi:hypothetical protein